MINPLDGKDGTSKVTVSNGNESNRSYPKSLDQLCGFTFRKLFSNHGLRPLGLQRISRRGAKM